MVCAVLNIEGRVLTCSYGSTKGHDGKWHAGEGGASEKGKGPPKGGKKGKEKGKGGKKKGTGLPPSSSGSSSSESSLKEEQRLPAGEGLTLSGPALKVMSEISDANQQYRQRISSLETELATAKRNLESMRKQRDTALASSYRRYNDRAAVQRRCQEAENHIAEGTRMLARWKTDDAAKAAAKASGKGTKG